MILPLLFLLAALASCEGLYDSSDDVIELTAGNFNGRVIDGDELWMVEFYAPWCGHCKSLAPEWKKAARALKGVVKVGAVDMDVHQSVGSPYNVRGFPTIKIFGANKKSPQDYQGARTSQGIIDGAMKAAKKMVDDKSQGRGGGGSGGGSSSGGGSESAGNEADVVTLTDENFEKEVFGTKDMVLVEFFAPWCGHCRSLAPEWAKAATQLKGKVKVCALDATVNTQSAQKYGVQGYPTIKFFPAGAKDAQSVEEFDGGRTANDIVQWALGRFVEDVDPPKIVELTENATLTAECAEKPLCIVSVLPKLAHGYITAEDRNAFIAVLKDLGEKYKSKKWGWLWTSARAHPKLEESLGIGGFGYPALVGINVKRQVYVTHKGSFQADSIDETLRALSIGRASGVKTLPVLAELETVAAWDGKDAPPEEDEPEIDLSELDDMDDAKVEL